jgi:hypothetical protein
MTRHDARPNGDSQCGRILHLLESRRGDWVPLPEILGMKISQYGTRIKELRDDWGFAIENRTETIDGLRHSWFRIAPSCSTAKSQESPSRSDWYEQETGGRPKTTAPTNDGLPLFKGEAHP